MPYIVLALVIIITLYLFNAMNVKTHELTYNKFTSYLTEQKVNKLTVTPTPNSYISPKL